MGCASAATRYFVQRQIARRLLSVLRSSRVYWPSKQTSSNLRPWDYGTGLSLRIWAGLSSNLCPDVRPNAGKYHHVDVTLMSARLVQRTYSDIGHAYTMRYIDC
jgi:hypothetical protein